MDEELPIHACIPQIKKSLAENNTLILQAPPGAGKSTVLPLHLLDENWLGGKKTLLLEPRRLAARAVASRLASQLNEDVGETVGYRIRFENRTGKNTRLEILTEGILTRMLQQDNALESVGLVIFDEFHERSLHADLALALCREAQQVLRNDLRLLIMSATLDGQQLSKLLQDAPVITSEGRQHPVTVHYFAPEQDEQIHLQMSKAIRRAVKNEKGDILAFFPGAGEIHRTQELLEQDLPGIKILPLYGDLSQQQQQEAIKPDAYGIRKIVLATSIAETSLTIEGIGVVVDCGYSRVPRFDQRTGLTRLETIKVSLDTADQRAGRAGRLGPGVCYRLWHEAVHRHLNAHRTPEILEADLAPTVLELGNWGVTDLQSLCWLTPPPAVAVKQAKELLQQLEAMDGNHITARGKQMLRFPTHPRIAHLLIEAQECGLAALGTDIAAALEERDPLPKESGGNLSLRVEALRKRRNKEFAPGDRSVLDRIERLATAWRKQLQVSADNKNVTDAEVGKLLASAYPERIAKKTGQAGKYRLANGRLAKLTEHDPLSHETWLAVAHLDAGVNEGKIFLAAPLDISDVLHRAYEKETLTWDAQKGELVAQKEKRIGDIIAESKPMKTIPAEKQLDVICTAVEKEGLDILPWNEECHNWLARVASLRRWRPEEQWPDTGKEKLLGSVREWLAPFLTQIRKRDDFRKLDLQMILETLLSWELQQKLQKLAPEKIAVPSGSLIRLDYFPDGAPPVLAVRLQEVFGLTDTPTVNEGRTKVMMHLLSPGYRPVQVTQDLKSFWQNTYPEVRKELRIRYQKHHWPEDPWTAEAVRGAKKRKQ
ncbi:MAG: ATP-dependent helicase HrpB [Bacteroidetes bacterium]|nr:MAG: ATP-dependent helicase HrpB [Bacteroidota bacterium]